ncbi:MAG: hypothetical protein AVDCRST_MAG66-3369 [uncultured Pseudonocardia sp.]|uniref:Lipoprotein n=1 Tax=uncultured Pseudonocardia sp. TaxID=211455 RepID=A0A6J4Q1B0_9PSEU|nr:MAG: hypothetical protein AVDCRST_MAG66-3369 [uncultured Pseudonocardia sp.]
MRRCVHLTALAAAAVLIPACGVGAAVTGGPPAVQGRSADPPAVAGPSTLPSQTLAPVVLRVDGEQVTITTACQQNGVLAQIEDDQGRVFGADGLGGPAAAGSEQPALTMTDVDGSVAVADATADRDDQGRTELRSSLSRHGGGSTEVSVAIDVEKLPLCGE